MADQHWLYVKWDVCPTCILIVESYCSHRIRLPVWTTLRQFNIEVEFEAAKDNTERSQNHWSFDTAINDSLVLRLHRLVPADTRLAFALCSLHPPVELGKYHSDF